MRSLRIAAVLCLVAGAAMADENSDLDMIPAEMKDAPPAPETTVAPRGKLSIEDAVTLGGLRGGMVVPVPGQAPPRWQNRTSFDARWQFDLGGDVALTISNRLNLFERDGLAVGQGRTASDDLREAYMTWEAAPRTYLEAGRINLREGVALGYNPTDFFRARTLLDQASADPSALRDNRLGTMMLRGQHIGDLGAVSISYAPKLTDPSRVGAGTTVPLDPHLDRTNAADRVLASVRADVAGLAPQALVFHDGTHTKFGFSATGTLGQRVVAYGEWAGGVEPTLVAEAVRYGTLTGTLPKGVPLLPVTGNGERFRNDLALGLSWTGETKLTINAEYHLHEAGFSRQDWRNWFALGRKVPALDGMLWYERGYAADQQVPIAQHQVFLRADWADAFVRDMDVTALAFINPLDGSSLLQVAAVQNFDRNWTAGLYVAGNLGAPRSEHGSLKGETSVTAQVQRFF